MSCEFFSFQSQKPALLPGIFVNMTEANVGIFSFQNRSDCVLYENNFIQAMDSGHVNAYFVTAQFAAVIGPSCGAMAWLINMIEWLFWSNTFTYLMAVLMLIASFGMQGMTFMIYGQREFCFDDNIAGECQMGMGAYMSIAAAGAFYIASVVWCCMPRSAPFCIARGNKGINKKAENSKDYDEFYAANTFETANTNPAPPQELENSNDYYTPSGESSSLPWADSDNRPPIPNAPIVDAESQYSGAMVPMQAPYGNYSTNGGMVPMQPQLQPSSSSFTTSTPMGYGSSSSTGGPPAGMSGPMVTPYDGSSGPINVGWQDHTSSWTGHEVSNPMNATHEEPFANPFALEDPMPANRPAYGNLQG